MPGQLLDKFGEKNVWALSVFGHRCLLNSFFRNINVRDTNDQTRKKYHKQNFRKL